MTLVCSETGRGIPFKELLFAGTRKSAKEYAALSYEVIRRIPRIEQRELPCDGNDEGIDIYLASSDEPTGAMHSVGSFKCKGFVFSITKETAIVRLPRFCRLMY